MAILTGRKKKTNGKPVKKKSIKSREVASSTKPKDTMHYKKTGSGGKTYTAFTKKGSPTAKMAKRFGGTIPKNLSHGKAKTEATDPYSAKNYTRSKSMSLAASDKEKVDKRKRIATARAKSRGRQTYKMVKGKRVNL